jgi:integrase
MGVRRASSKTRPGLEPLFPFARTKETTTGPVIPTLYGARTMTETTTNPVARRGRVVLTNRLCEARNVPRRERKLYDSRCDSLYVSRNANGTATFSLQVRDRFTGRTRCKWLGRYDPENFTVDDARAVAYAEKARIGAGENIFERLRQHRALKAKQGKTVDEIIAERVEWIKAPVRKPFGEMRARVETWRNVESHMRRFISPRLGRMIAADVTNDDIAAISNEIAETSVSNARHFRRSVGSLFKWAAEAGRKYVERSPYHDLPRLPREHARKRCLKAHEIKAFWNALDDSNRTHLAMKFGLVSMLRSGEYLPLRRDELHDLDGDSPVAIIPAGRTKKRQQIIQPLSQLAISIIELAMREGEELVFGRHRSALGNAARGRKDKNTEGLCKQLKLDHFTVHDLRRTSSTLAADLGHRDSWIAACLNHEAKGEDSAPSVTFVYQRSERLDQKREVLDAVAAELLRIVGESVKQSDTEKRVAA